MRRAVWKAWLGCFALALWGCGGDDADAPDEADCVSDLDYFQQVSLTLLERDCLRCHNPQGEAKNSKLLLASRGETSYLQTNFERLRDIASLEKDGVSLLLLKPTERVEHKGGARFAVDSKEYKALVGLVERFDAPVECGETDGSALLEKVVVLDLPDTLRKVKVQLLGALPTPDELQRVSDEGEPAFDDLVRGYLAEEPFYDTLKRWWNDRLLTDKYLGGDRAANLLDEATYPQRRYYQALDAESEQGALAREFANNSVARAPLELIAHVVRADRPFTEVLTADYMLVNPFSAPVYGAEVDFDDPLDPTEWREVKLPGIPHAGLLTSPMFLNRFPTTATNRNRHRSRMVWALFLATDILQQADRPVDPTAIREHNPTMNSAQCTVCHTQLDPLAGAFLNWDERGRYLPPESWHADMRPPGFGEDAIPPDEWPRSLRWTARRITEDERFALSAVYAVFEGLVGRAPTQNPTDDTDPRFQAKLKFHNLEQGFLRAATARFVENDHDLKSVILDVVRSPFYRGYSAFGLSGDDELVLEHMGTTRLLTPEELDARLRATVGYPWKNRVRDRNQLLDGREYLFFYGGIDSDTVTRRISEPNGIMANVALRMANEMGCLVSPRDFWLPAAQRVLFPHVEPGYRPEDDNGFLVPGAVETIRRNIRYLHHRLLGEVLTPGHPEEEATFQLYLQTWREGYQAVRNGQVHQDLPNQCRVVRDFWTDADLPEDQRLFRDTDYTIRAWSAVITYLLADWRFLYHQ